MIENNSKLNQLAFHPPNPLQRGRRAGLVLQVIFDTKFLIFPLKYFFCIFYLSFTFNETLVNQTSTSYAKQKRLPL